MFSGLFQLTMAVSLLRSGYTPFGPMVAPANSAVVMKNLEIVIVHVLEPL